MTGPLLEIDDVVCDFPLPHSPLARIGRRERAVLRAVDHVTLSVAVGSCLAIVGESGCGKSTLARAVVGLVTPTSGTIRLDEQALAPRRDPATQRRIQMVFQDPSSSLNPKLTVGETIDELIRHHRLRPPHQVKARCRELLEEVELPASVYDLRPQALSGGQRQRAAIARALALEPDLLIADEAVSALDVSVQAAILNLLNRLRHELGLAMLFISHDLSVVRHVSDDVAVLYLGQVVETRPAAELFGGPAHPYTKALFSAAPRLDVVRRPGGNTLAGELPSAIDRPIGCPVHSRCPVAIARCASDRPALIEVGGGLAACHLLPTPEP